MGQKPYETGDFRAISRKSVSLRTQEPAKIAVFGAECLFSSPGVQYSCLQWIK